jgi:hypothetical protein
MVKFIKILGGTFAVAIIAGVSYILPLPIFLQYGIHIGMNSDAAISKLKSQGFKPSITKGASTHTSSTMFFEKNRVTIIMQWSHDFSVMDEAGLLHAITLENN